VPEAVEAEIDKLWIPDSPIHLIEAHQGVMYRARDLLREQKRQGRHSLRSADAVHLATAVFYEISTVFTYDDRLLALDGSMGLTIGKPEPLEPRLDLS
jgi:predicted nucleic acid-binding protein